MQRRLHSRISAVHLPSEQSACHALYSSCSNEPVESASPSSSNISGRRRGQQPTSSLSPVASRRGRGRVRMVAPNPRADQTWCGLELLSEKSTRPWTLTRPSTVYDTRETLWLAGKGDDLTKPCTKCAMLRPSVRPPPRSRARRHQPSVPDGLPGALVAGPPPPFRIPRPKNSQTVKVRRRGAVAEPQLALVPSAGPTWARWTGGGLGGGTAAAPSAKPQRFCREARRVTARRLVASVKRYTSEGEFDWWGMPALDGVECWSDRAWCAQKSGHPLRTSS